MARPIGRPVKIRDRHHVGYACACPNPPPCREALNTVPSRTFEFSALTIVHIIQGPQTPVFWALLGATGRSRGPPRAFCRSLQGVASGLNLQDSLTLAKGTVLGTALGGLLGRLGGPGGRPKRPTLMKLLQCVHDVSVLRAPKKAQEAPKRPPRFQEAPRKARRCPNHRYADCPNAAQQVPERTPRLPKRAPR